MLAKLFVWIYNVFQYGTKRSERRVMYVLTKNCRRIEDNEVILFGVADESHDFGDFTDDMTKAANLVELLNSQNVESIHVHDIIEDMFY